MLPVVLSSHADKSEFSLPRWLKVRWPCQLSVWTPGGIFYTSRTTSRVTYSRSSKYVWEIRFLKRSRKHVFWRAQVQVRPVWMEVSPLLLTTWVIWANYFLSLSPFSQVTLEIKNIYLTEMLWEHVYTHIFMQINYLP